MSNMFETKTMLTTVSILFALLSYIPYFRDIFRGKTKPHAFTWLVWCVMTTSAYFTQLADGGGVASWVLAFTALVNFVIFALSLYKGETDITPLDWFCLFGAFIGLALFAFNEDELLSVFIVSSVNLVGFIPTVRKSMLRPDQETATTFAFTSLKYFFSVLALEHFTIGTVLFPVTVGISNMFFVLLLLVRRNQLGYRLKKRTMKKAQQKSKLKPARA
jgi:hypothetical protein